MHSRAAHHITSVIENLTILVVDDQYSARKLIRLILLNLGIRKVFEASDGGAGLQAIRAVNPDALILDWEMPIMNGPEVVRAIRSPGAFPTPDIPIIMLSGYAEHWRVEEAHRLGVKEYLVKPTSPKAVQDRLLSIVLRWRSMARLGEYSVPEHRTVAAGS